LAEKINQQSIKGISMKRLVLALSTLMVLTLPGWGQNTAHDQAKAAAAEHREEVRSNPDRPHHRKKHHRHHHRKHNGA
jgi:hypothetical protein